MNEMYVITVLMIYSLVVIIDTLIDAYALFAPKSNTNNEFIYPKSAIVSTYVTPTIFRINLLKENRLNMKRRPPILNMAH